MLEFGNLKTNTFHKNFEILKPKYIRLAGQANTQHETINARNPDDAPWEKWRQITNTENLAETDQQKLKLCNAYFMIKSSKSIIIPCEVSFSSFK